MIYDEYASIVFFSFLPISDRSPLWRLFHKHTAPGDHMICSCWLYHNYWSVMLLSICFYSSAAVNIPVIVVADNYFVWKGILCVRVWVLVGVYTCKDQKLVLCVFLSSLDFVFLGKVSYWTQPCQFGSANWPVSQWSTCLHTQASTGWQMHSTALALCLFWGSAQLLMLYEAGTFYF